MTTNTTPHPTDIKGVEIHVGDTVAYAAGGRYSAFSVTEITEVKKSVKIQGHWTGPKNVLVLKRADGSRPEWLQ